MARPSIILHSNFAPKSRNLVRTPGPHVISSSSHKLDSFIILNCKDIQKPFSITFGNCSSVHLQFDFYLYFSFH